MKWFSLILDDEKFQVTFQRRAKVLHQDFFEAADAAIHQLLNDYPNRLFLALSGGVDSEFVANTLIRNKIKFTPIIVKTENYNSLETWYAEYWCKANAIEPVVLFQTEQDAANNYARFFKTMMQLDNFTQVEVLLAYEYAHQMGGHCIYGGGDMNPNDRGEFYSTSIDFISDIVDLGNHPTSFFMYTPELALSYITKFDKALDEQYNKLKFYNVPVRPKIHYHGYYQSGKVQEVKEKLCYLNQIDPVYLKYNIYGTQEQIVQSLQP